MEYLLTVKKASGDDEEARIPAGVIEIGDGAFRGKTKLKRVVIPDSCTTIGDYAFDDCRSLEEIVLPASITSIGSFAFKNCSSLTHVTLSENLDTIPKQAFARCTKLTTVDETDHIHTVGADAFTGCVSLRAFDASTAEFIGDRAFSSCRALESVVFGDELKRIGSFAFRSCPNLHSVSIPDGVMRLETNIFSGCRDIEIHASETVVRAFPDAFPRKTTLAYGLIRPQDVRDLSSQFRRNHIEDENELRNRHNELVLQADELRQQIARLGVMDLKERDRAVAELDDVLAELQEIEALLDELAHPSMRTLVEEFVGV